MKIVFRNESKREREEKERAEFLIRSIILSLSPSLSFYLTICHVLFFIFFFVLFCFCLASHDVLLLLFFCCFMAVFLSWIITRLLALLLLCILDTWFKRKSLKSLIRNICIKSSWVFLVL